MATLYGLLLCLLLIAIGIIAIPFARQQQLTSRYFLLIAGIMLISAGTLYRFSANTAGLQQWFSVGAEHYALQEKFMALGGVDGAILRIKAKLAIAPEDAAGWVLLGKLYLSKQDTAQAKTALAKAHSLQPADPETTHLYQLVNP